MSDEWTTPVELAKKLGVAPRTVRYMLRKDEVPVTVLSAKWRIRRRDAEAFLARRQTT